MEILRNVDYGQFRGCVFLQVWTIVIVLFDIKGETSIGLEICTPSRWFALRPCGLIWRRR